MKLSISDVWTSPAIAWRVRMPSLVSGSQSLTIHDGTCELPMVNDLTMRSYSFAASSMLNKPGDCSFFFYCFAIPSASTYAPTSAAVVATPPPIGAGQYAASPSSTTRPRGHAPSGRRTWLTVWQYKSSASGDSTRSRTTLSAWQPSTPLNSSANAAFCYGSVFTASRAALPTRVARYTLMFSGLSLRVMMALPPGIWHIVQSYVSCS
jgi:hypothetical protein